MADGALLLAAQAAASGVADAEANPAGMMMSPMAGPSGMLQRLEAFGHNFYLDLREVLADAADAPGRAGSVVAFLAGRGDQGSVVEVLLGLAAALVLATLAAWLGWRVLAPTRNRLEGAIPGTAGRLIRLKIEALLVDLAPVALFLAVAAPLSRLLDRHHGGPLAGPDGAAALADAVVAGIVTGWVALVLLCLPLAAGRPALRILPLGEVQAAWAERTLTWIMAVAIAGWTLAAGLYVSGFGSGLSQLILVADGIAVAALCLRALHRVRHSVSGFARHWHKLASVSVFGLGLTWIHGLVVEGPPPLRHVLWTVLVLLVMPGIDGMAMLALARLKSRLMVRVARRRLIFMPSGENDQLTAVERPALSMDPGPESAGMDAALSRLVAAIHDAISWAVLFAAAAALSAAWEIDLGRVLGHAGERTIFGTLVNIGTTALVGWYLWRLFGAGLAVLLARDDRAPQSRSKTVEPLLRSVGVVIIGIGALMTTLSEVGISIAPLLASAGVIGIAVGFGAQTLVKDLFSGACFLVEDVFRIGEYIEAGSAKGTVEKITFRTVALRHQNGPLHFVPYGSLGTVRNNSRDWVIDKFELPLPTETDGEVIRRMVKRIGQEMLEDEVLAATIMAPLKAKLYRIDPGVKVFRCKVQTLPGLQFEVRNEAYRRIEIALKAAGIPFATNTPSVTVQAPPAVQPLPALGLASAAAE